MTVFNFSSPLIFFLLSSLACSSAFLLHRAAGLLSPHCTQWNQLWWWLVTLSRGHRSGLHSVWCSTPWLSAALMQPHRDHCQRARARPIYSGNPSSGCGDHTHSSGELLLSRKKKIHHEFFYKRRGWVAGGVLQWTRERESVA